jgi:hypothetical protein
VPRTPHSAAQGFNTGLISSSGEFEERNVASRIKPLSTMIGLESHQGDSFNDARLESNGECAIGMNAFNKIWTVGSRFQLIWLKLELQDFIAHLIIIRIPFGIGVNEALVIQPLPALLEQLEIRYKWDV